MTFLEPTDIKDMGARYSHYPGPFAIDEPDLQKIFPGIENFPNAIAGTQYQKGDLDDYNLTCINRITATVQPKTILEIGTFRGRTTLNLATWAPKAHVITIDIANIVTDTFSSVDMDYHQEPDKVGIVFKDTEQSKRITQIIADSLTQECALLVDAKLKGRKIDLAFIDGGHDYDSVKHNFEELVLPRMKEGGVVVFDDYNRPLSIVGVTHYLLEKAYKDSYVFYWFAPKGREKTNEVIFVNNKESKTYNWRGEKEGCSEMNVN